MFEGSCENIFVSTTVTNTFMALIFVVIADKFNAYRIFIQFLPKRPQIIKKIISFFPIHVMKALGGGSRGIVSHILSLGALLGDEWLTLHPGHSAPWKFSRYQLNRRLDGLQSPSGRFLEKRIIFCPFSGIRTSDRPASIVIGIRYTDYDISLFHK